MAQTLATSPSSAVESGPLAALRRMQSLRDIPLLRQLGTLLMLALAIAAGLVMFFWSQKPDYAPLYTGLAEKDAAALTDVLRAAEIPYRLDPASGALTVPGDQIHAARLAAAAKGLPQSGAQGFELIQQDQGFGASQFIESARYQLALETELARTVSSLQPVKSARVHLALPKPSAFTQNRGSASASVVVELHSGRQLENDQVSAIEHIVASSVPGLTPSAVTVIDQLGRLLSRSAESGELVQSAEHYQYARRAESDYVQRIEKLLAPMLGLDKISAQVAADFDFSVIEEARESYRPDGAVVRSEQVSEDTRRDRRSAAAGIPGATSNQPPAPAAQTAAVQAPAAVPAEPAATAAQEPPASTTRSQTRNFEIDRTLSHTRQSVGRLRRLSVAVLIDNVHKLDADGKPVSAPLTAEELAKVEALVKQAVGFDAGRGDSVTVQNAPFISRPVEPLPPLPLWQRPELRSYARQGLGTLAVLVLILAVLRPMLRNLMGASRSSASAETAMARTHDRAELVDSNASADYLPSDQLSLSGDRAPSAAALAVPAYEQRLGIARNAVAQDPKRVAQVMKTWLNEDG